MARLVRGVQARGWNSKSSKGEMSRQEGAGGGGEW